MKKYTKYQQKGTSLCYLFSTFGILSYNFSKDIAQESVMEWARKNNIQPNVWWQARFVANKLADGENIVMKTFLFNSKEYNKYLDKWYAVSLSLRAPVWFWKDALDGNIDLYEHLEMGKTNHAVFVVRDVQGTWIINSLGDLIKPFKVDLSKIPRKWIHWIRCFTLLPK